jgi:hypothetical protein
MRTPQEIIAELKNVTYWSQPNIKFNDTMALLNELEATLNPVEEEPIIEEPIVEEEPTVEEPTVEEPTVEENPVAKKPTAKKTTKK